LSEIIRIFRESFSKTYSSLLAVSPSPSNIINIPEGEGIVCLVSISTISLLQIVGSMLSPIIVNIRREAASTLKLSRIHPALKRYGSSSPLKDTNPFLIFFELFNFI